MKVVGITFTYPLTAVLTSGINTRFRQVESTGVGQKDSGFNVGANMKYSWTRNLLGAVDIKYNDNESNLGANVYKETIIYISLVYRG